MQRVFVVDQKLKPLLPTFTGRMKRAVISLLLVVAFGCLLTTNAIAFCFEEAGKAYGISPLLLWGIAKTESSLDPSAINKNTNGSYDYGVMQINSSWYRTLGTETWNRLSDPCTNVQVGAWVLAQCIQRYGYNWDAVGCYNSGNPARRKSYAKKVFHELKRAGYGQQ